MPDLVVALEKAVLAHLRNDPSVIAVIPADSLHAYDGAPPSPPRPFAKPGTQITSPLTGHRRRRNARFTMYVRADTRKHGAQTVETARDHLGRCAGVIIDSLYRSRVPIEGGTAKLVLVNDIRRMVDGEKDSMEANIEFRARVMAG